MKKLTLILSLFAGILGRTQDFHLSQYDAAALNVNPALTGLFKGDYRIHGHYRTQWSAVASKPFTTGLVGFDMKYNKNWGFGGQIANFRAGSGGYNVVSVLPSASYKFAFGEEKFHFISFGAQAGFFQKSINWCFCGETNGELKESMMSTRDKKNDDLQTSNRISKSFKYIGEKSNDDTSIIKFKSEVYKDVAQNQISMF